MVKLLVMDVDGTLTDGHIYIGDSGELMKSFHVHDGYAIQKLLPLYKILPVIITGRHSSIVEYRSRELGILHVYQNVSNKKGKLDELLKQLETTYDNVFYIGDDLNDLECIKEAHLSACPCNAVTEIKEHCTFISSKSGGNGAVREFVDWIIKNTLQ